MASGLYVRSGPNSGPFYYIKSRMHGYVLDVYGERQSPGTDVILYPKKPGAADNQLWYFEDAGDGFVYICSKLNGLVLDIYGASGRRGTKIILWHRKSSPEITANQKWKIDGDFIVSALHAQVLDVKGASKAEVTPLIVWSKNVVDNEHQRWEIERVYFSGEDYVENTPSGQSSLVDVKECGVAEYKQTVYWETKTQTESLRKDRSS